MMLLRVKFNLVSCNCSQFTLSASGLEIILTVGGQAGDIMPITRTMIDVWCRKRQGNSAGYDFVWSGHDGGV